MSSISPIIPDAEYTGPEVVDPGIIRKIEWTVTKDTLILEPKRVQDAGIQGEHNATLVRFRLPEVFGNHLPGPENNVTITVVMEHVTAYGELDVSEALNVKHTSILDEYPYWVEYRLPEAWTQHGGEATIRLVLSRENAAGEKMVAFTAEGRVRYKKRERLLKKVSSVIEQSIHALLDRCRRSVDEVEAVAEKTVEEIETAMDEAVEAASAHADAAEAAAEKAETKVESLIERNNKHPVSLWVGTKAEYAAIRDKDEGRLYLISDDNDLSGFANPHNLLDNSDFTNPVNQRGKTAYTEASGYTIDRWKKRGAPEESTVAVESGGIRIKRTSQNAYTGIFQIHKYRAAAFAGKTFTFAVKIKECGTRVGIRIIGSSNGDNNSYVADTIADKPGIYTVTATIPATYAETYIGVAIIPGMTSSTGVDGAAGDVVVEWAALYEGIYAADNVPAYKPKGYAAELAECQRYYNKIVSAILNGYITASARDLFVQIPCAQMIKAPTFSFSGAFTVRTLTGYSNIAHETTPSTYKHVATNSVGVRVSLGWGELITELDANQGKYYDYGETLGVVADVNNTPAALHTGIIELSAEY